MIYINIWFDDESYKKIATRLNVDSLRFYFIVEKIFDDLKKIYADFNKLQTFINAFTRFIQNEKYSEFQIVVLTEMITFYYTYVVNVIDDWLF